VKRRENSAESFHKFFAGVYGERWPALRDALALEPRKSILSNPFGLESYSLDEASTFPVKNLALHPGLFSADFCASPGGKSLAAIFSLKGEGEWLLSDLSPGRVKRLKGVLHDCLPENLLRERVKVVQGDASRWGMRYKESFDRVLVDAPCSGERHLLESPTELARWSEKGSKRLAVRQHALLCAGLDSLRSGGRVVYSTCSISPYENDAVVDKLSKSRADLFDVVSVNESMGEATRHGWILLPDVCGCGPIYFSVLQKR
jgi:16S rRNA C967 or C1407 C5-methylase (RsmB/RsmF family)